MKIRLVVQLDKSCLETEGLHYGLAEQNIYKPVKLQYGYENELGHVTEWEDVEIVFQ